MVRACPFITFFRLLPFRLLLGRHTWLPVKGLVFVRKKINNVRRNIGVAYPMAALWTLALPVGILDLAFVAEALGWNTWILFLLGPCSIGFA